MIQVSLKRRMLVTNSQPFEKHVIQSWFYDHSQQFFPWKVSIQQLFDLCFFKT